jgi:hypothetical protein
VYVVYKTSHMTHPSRGQEHRLGYMVSSSSDNAKCNSREYVGVVALARVVLLPVVLYWRERRPGREYATTLEY